MAAATRKIVDVKSLKLEHIQYSDLDQVNRLMELELYDVGLENLQIYYSCSDNSIWKCIKNEKKEIFAVDMGNLLPNGVDYGYILIIHPDYRNLGISALFKSQWSEHPYMGSESLKSVSIYAKEILQCWRGKMLVYYGLVPKKMGGAYWQYVENNFSLQHVTLQPIEKSKNLSKIVEFDRKIIKIDRKKFLEKWCCSERSISYAAVDQKKRCLGYGVLRNFTGHNRYGISPLYAETPEIATLIFGRLAQEMDGQYLYVPCMAHQRVSNHFCKFFNLVFCDSEIRDCNLKALNYVKTLDMAKVYTTHDYWPV